MPARGGNPAYNPAPGATPTIFDSIFGATGGYAGKTLLDVLGLMGNPTGRDGLARHIVAALLNAAAGVTPPAVLSAQTVLDIWTSFVTKGYYEPTAGIKWDAPDLIDWLKTTQPI